MLTLVCCGGGRGGEGSEKQTAVIIIELFNYVSLLEGKGGRGETLTRILVSKTKKTVT